MDYCFECSKKEFEQFVINLFISQGYSVQKTSDSAYFTAKLIYGFSQIHYQVFIVYKVNSNLDIDDIMKVIELKTVKSNSQKGLIETYLVHNSEINQNAYLLLDNNYIVSKSDTDLINGIIDFTPYFNNVINEYETSAVKEHYVPSKIKLGDFSEFEHKTGLLNSYVDEFLNRENETLLIFGEYGAGKTSFCLNYTYSLIKRYIEKEVNVIPIMIKLRDYSKGVSLAELITDYFINKCGIVNANIKTFQQLLKYKKILILYDGFDEVSKRVDYDTKLRLYNEIISFQQENTKIIITCRPNFFEDITEYKKIFKDQHPYYEPIEIKKTTIEEVTLSAFDKDDIKNFILSYEKELIKNDISIDQFLYEIENIHDLKDLATRPVLLAIIVYSLPKILKERSNNKKINSADLYSLYTEEWLNRENEKGKTLIRSSDKRFFCENLAFELATENQFSLNYKKLPNKIKEYFSNINSITDLDYFSHDIRSCSFLNSDGKGNYSFVHNSFMEFFVAKNILTEISKVNLDGDEKSKNKLSLILDSIYISTEISLFICDILEQDKNQLTHFQNIIKMYWKKLDNSCLVNTVSIIAKLGHPLLKEILVTLIKHNYEGYLDLSYADFTDFEFVGGSRKKTNFYKSKIKKCTFKRCDLENVNFSQCQIINCSFEDCNMDFSDFTNSLVKKSMFYQVSLCDSNLSGSWFDLCKFDNSELTLAQTSVTTNFETTTGLEYCFGVPYELG